MRKRRRSSKFISLLTVVALLIFSWPGVAYATTEQITQTACNQVILSFWTFGQSFTTIKPGSIDSVVLRLNSDIVSSDVTVTIHSMPIGPGSALGTSSLQEILPGDILDIADYTDYTFTFSSPVAVEAGVTYALIVYDEDFVGVSFCYQDTDVYSGGDLLLFHSEAWHATTGDLCFTVNMTIATYTINYIAGTGGSIVGSATQVVDYGTDTASVTATAEPGYSFVEWSDSNLNETRNETNVMASTSYTAIFAPNNYTITFNSAGGSAVAPITQDYGTAITAPANPVREGYTFAGWSPVVPTTMPVNGAALTAQWTINQYTVQFLNWDGSVLSAQTVLFGGSAVPPTVPERSGYSFSGWDHAYVSISGNVAIMAVYLPVTGEDSGSLAIGIALLMAAAVLSLLRFWRKKGLVQ